MSQLAVYRNPDGAGYLLNVQADVNDHYATRVVVPLFKLDTVKDYAKTLKKTLIYSNSVIPAKAGIQ